LPPLQISLYHSFHLIYWSEFPGVLYSLITATTKLNEAKSFSKGNLEDGFAFAGANAYRVDKIISVKELIETLTEEYGCSNAAVATVQKTDIEHFK